MTQLQDFRGSMPAPTLLFGDEDQNLNATSDYFWMLRCGVLEEHTPGSWKTFRTAYAAMGDHLRSNDDGPPPRRRAA